MRCEHVQPLSVGLNCSLGPDLMYPFLQELSEKADVAISCYPNAGLPNPLSATGFDLEPADMARYLGEFAHEGLDQHCGGCCGNTPEHIAAIAKALEGVAPRHWNPGDAARSRPERHDATDGVDVDEATSPVRIAAIHAAARRVHHDRRADQCGRVAEVRQAGQGRASTKKR